MTTPTCGGAFLAGFLVHLAGDGALVVLAALGVKTWHRHTRKEKPEPKPEPTAADVMPEYITAAEIVLNALLDAECYTDCKGVCLAHFDDENCPRARAKRLLGRET